MHTACTPGGNSLIYRLFLLSRACSLSLLFDILMHWHLGGQWLPPLSSSVNPGAHQFNIITTSWVQCTVTWLNIPCLTLWISPLCPSMNWCTDHLQIWLSFLIKFYLLVHLSLDSVDELLIYSDTWTACIIFVLESLHLYIVPSLHVYINQSSHLHNCHVTLQSHLAKWFHFINIHVHVHSYWKHTYKESIGFFSFIFGSHKIFKFWFSCHQVSKSIYPAYILLKKEWLQTCLQWRATFLQSSFHSEWLFHSLVFCSVFLEWTHFMLIIPFETGDARKGATGETPPGGGGEEKERRGRSWRLGKTLPGNKNDLTSCIGSVIFAWSHFLHSEPMAHMEC